jgi:hypothetical protein
LVLTARDLLRCKNYPSSWTYDLKSYSDVLSLIKSDDQVALSKTIRHIHRILEKTKATVLIANSTIDPINRLWLQIGRLAGLKTICVQHGLYSRSIPSYVLEEDIIDQYISLDAGQSSILIRNIPEGKILNIGRPTTFEWIPPPRPLRICFVGEDWERYGFTDLKYSVIQRYKELVVFLKGHGYHNFYYKTHPSEQMLLDIESFTNILKPIDFGLPDVYFGFGSTLLKEMSSKNKMAIQILDPVTGADNFQELGYCLTFINYSDMFEALPLLLCSKNLLPKIVDSDLTELLNLD